ncbi:hypothetical protein BDV95DRAFT_591276 [Massariosphaeria phaeospora]|uniref:Rhodopsin domain-containing protein n=1 Tax=Massariosphaeria phaeospora TaxID=100035 RepID=A0A7C8IFE8_9PLEO|nr:hypothetical protein BDV95DRAFT_591276 [Massariosphaeria phaeospora]
MTSSSRYDSAFDSPHSRAVLVVVVVFTITSTFSLVSRLVAKRIQKLDIAAEDWTIVAAQIAVYGMATCAILAIVLGGLGHHAATQPEKVSQFLKILVAMQVFYGTTLGLIKVSICLFYNRIFPLRGFRQYSWLVIALITAWSVMVFLSAFLLCRPLAFNWDQTIPGGKCANQPAAFVAIGVLDLIVDVMVLMLPMPLLWNLKVSLPNKVALFAIFGVGVFTMVISILRIVALLAVDYVDITFTASYPTLWSFTEPAIGISVACAPLLRPLFRNGRLGRLFSQKMTGGSSSSRVSNFQRLNDPSYTLTSLGPHTSVVGGDSRRTDGEDSQRYSDERHILAQPQGITVTREWQTERV